MLLRIKIAYFIRAGGLAIPTSNTTVRIDKNNPILPLVCGFYRTYRDANRIITLIAVDGKMLSRHIRESSLFN